jgi:GLPGLI family protein
MFFLVSIPNLYAQTSYQVTYNISEIKLQGSIDNLDEKGKRITKQVSDKAKDVHYTLISNKDNSYFELENTLRKESDSPLDDMLSRMAKRFPSFNKKVYTNHNENTIIFVRNLMNQDFLVERDCYNFNWIIKGESKSILGLVVKKAEGNYYDPVTEEELKVEAWFVPSIPLQSGPDIFNGLPGLIAEVNLKGAVVSVISIEPNMILKTEEMDTAKAMTQEEYESLLKSLTKKYMEN